MGKKLLYILIACMGCFMCHSCIEDGFTTSSSDLLEFSCDSVKFDTVFTELGTPTKTFVVYNRHKKQLNISSIRVAGGSKNFRINVDGRSGEVFNDIEVRGQDSIYVFVECYIDANESDKPIEVSDKLEFVTNGVTQKITLNAWGQDVVRLYNERVEHGELRLTAAKPYVIFDSLTVDEGARLVIEPDAKLHFHKGAKLRIDGTLQAQGTQGHEIIMRGDRIDNVVGEYSFELMSGQWWGVVFGTTSEGNEMSYVNMRSSSYGVEVYGTNGENRNLHLFNSILHNSSGDVLRCENAWVEAEGCEFSDAAAVVVRILGGRTQLVHCTLANYYLFEISKESILTIDHGNYDMRKFVIDNSIIYGMTNDISPGEFPAGVDVLLRNCLFKSKGTDDNNFINSIWDADPLFYVIRNDYLFDYRLKNDSPAIGTGDNSFCPDHARYDRYGEDRRVRDRVDVGAYTWVPTTTEEKQ